MSHPEHSCLTGLRRMVVVVGAFGSGKTEISLNLARRFAADGPTRLIDLDIVNPYFRSSSQRLALEERGIEVISPRFAMTAVDVPALTPEIERAFERDCRAIFDVGGDETGAAALGRYIRRFEAEAPDVLYVINALRPMTATPEANLAILRRVVQKGRLSPTMLINNTNLQDETQLEDVLAGQAMIEEAGRQAGIPVGLIGCTAAIAERLPDCLRARTLLIERQLRLDWGDG